LKINERKIVFFLLKLLRNPSTFYRTIDHFFCTICIWIPAQFEKFSHYLPGYQICVRNRDRKFRVRSTSKSKIGVLKLFQFSFDSKSQSPMTVQVTIEIISWSGIRSRSQQPIMPLFSWLHAEALDSYWFQFWFLQLGFHFVLVCFDCDTRHHR